MRVDAIILARGGSKGIPNKNIVDFCNKPLLIWTIEQCLNSKLINDVWVSSDDKKILEIANASGVNSITRPDSISADESSSESGWAHAIEYLKSQKVNADIILAPQVTSPLRESKDFDFAIEKFISRKYDSLFSASAVNDLFFWKKNETGLLKSINYDYKNRQRRQNFQEQIIENGSFYLFKPNILLETNNRLGGKIGCYKMEFWKMFEIDDIADLKLCTAIMNEFVELKGTNND
jgi:CMP-N,N'-diacetyllegionaminic acid synthase